MEIINITKYLDKNDYMDILNSLNDKDKLYDFIKLVLEQYYKIRISYIKVYASLGYKAQGTPLLILTEILETLSRKHKKNLPYFIVNCKIFTKSKISY